MPDHLLAPPDRDVAARNALQSLATHNLGDLSIIVARAVGGPDSDRR
jgi:hypothetical protein